MAVRLQAEIGQATLFQALEHDLQRGHLLADEQHALAGRHALGDDISDRLAFAGARRPLQHKALAGQRGGDRLSLARIGVEHLEAILGRAAVEIEGWGMGAGGWWFS